MVSVFSEIEVNTPFSNANVGSQRTIKERRETRQHLIEENTKRPPVYDLACVHIVSENMTMVNMVLTVSLIVENLRGKVFRCTTERVRRV